MDAKKNLNSDDISDVESLDNFFLAFMAEYYLII